MPEVEILLTASAMPMLATAVAAAGGRLGAVSLRQARYVPGRSLTVSYRADVAGRPALLVAHAGEGMPAGSALLDGGDARVGIWRYPNDPRLPGLPHAADGRLLPALLSRFRIGGEARRGRRRAYRPLRRAVVEVTVGERRMFLKVVRPERLAGLLERYRAFGERLRAPAVLGVDADLGILALSAVPGMAVREAVADPAGPALPGAGALAALLDRLPELPGAAPGPLDRFPGHARLLRAIAPGCERVLDCLAAEVADAPAAPAAPAHGDFHAGQVLLGGDGALGLVDVDTAGTGSRADDVATMVGYLAARAADRSPPARAEAYARRLRDGFGRRGYRALQPRIAAAIAGFATIPFAAQWPDWPDAIERRLAATGCAAS